MGPIFHRGRLDHRQASATELAAAYAQRWEIETAFDELKTHQRGPNDPVTATCPNQTAHPNKQ